jgi:AraC-like DNA-binding protein
VEQRWLPVLACALPLPIPQPLAMGEPGHGYAWKWSIYRWIPGEVASPEAIKSLPDFSRQLARFLVSLQKIDATSGPRPGPQNFYRGGNLSAYPGARVKMSEAATESLRNIRIFIEALERLGYNGEALLQVLQLRRTDLDEPDGRVPCSLVGAMFGRAMQERPLKNLGARMAAETLIGAYPLVDYLVLTSETVGGGLRNLSQYFRLVVDAPVSLELRDEGDVVRAYYESELSGALSCEFGVTLPVLHLRRETEDRFRAEYVSFSHRPDDVDELERLLGCPVRFNASWNGWVMSRATWELPLRRRDSILSGVLETQAAEMLERLHGKDGITLQVRRLLISRVAGGDTDIEAVARALAMSTRSLQRQLTAEGVSYRELLEATRKDAAERYLANSSLPIDEIAFLLGYSDVAAFHRAFKRWNNSTPLTFRQQHSLRRRPAF